MSQNSNELPVGCVPLAESLTLGKTVDVASPVVAYQASQPIEIELPDGRKIGMARPKMSLSSFVAGVLSNVDYKNVAAFEVERARVRSLLYITDIDGAVEPKISDPIMRAALEQKLGDENLDAIFATFAAHFPSNDVVALKTVKKS